jgi:hypothetical protein
MQTVRTALVFLLLVIGFYVHGQAPGNVKQPRILILLDGSSSMGNKWIGNERRFDAASRIITALIDSLYKVNKDVEFALRVYGHQYPAQENNCYDTRREVMFSKDNLTQMSLRLAALRPIGVSPIAFSLKEAVENDLIDPLRNTYSLILVTDGGESCGGNICEVMEKLLSKKIEFKPYILSLVNDAMLKGQYDCLGNYLLVSKEDELKPAVGKIVDAYRQMFVMQRIDKKLLESAVVNTPSVLKVDIPKFKVTQEVETPAAEPPKPKPEVTRPPVQQPPVVVPQPTRDITNRTNAPAPAPEKKLAKEIIESMSIAKSVRSLPVYYATREYTPLYLPPFKLPAIPDEPQPKPVPTATPPVVAVPATKPPVITPKPQPKPVATKPPAQTTKPQELKTIKQESTDNTNKESTLIVLFTDGKNKFYQSAPEIVLYDVKTNKPVHKFNRTVDVYGKPHPQKITAGTYNLRITGKSNLVVPNVVVEPSKDNTVLVQVTKGSIDFAYLGNGKRPMTDYKASVVKRFDSAPVVYQKTTERIEYEPGTYFVEVNTLPPWRKSFDLDFGTIHGIEIPEEGDLIIDNSKQLGKVSLYYPYGDKFRIFYSLNVDGSGKELKLKVLPGTYRAGYKKNPNLPYAEETMVDFSVTSNNVTNLVIQ